MIKNSLETSENHTGDKGKNEARDNGEKKQGIRIRGKMAKKK